MGISLKERERLPCRRPVVTQKVKIAGKRTVYVSVHDAEMPGELFLRMSGPDLTPELIACYDIIAPYPAWPLQYGVPVDSVGGSWKGEVRSVWAGHRSADSVLLQSD